MTSNRATERLIDAQALLGVGAFCLAERHATLAAAAVGVYAVLRVLRCSGPRCPLPLPPWASNALALLAVGLLFFQVRRPGVELVVAMGLFTAMLQGLLLAGRRSGRDDALLLVLGLIQVLAASVLSSTVLDGVALMAWCAVAAAALTRLAMRTARERIRERNAALGAAGPLPTAQEAPIGRVFVVGATVATLVAAAVFVATPRRESGSRADATATLGALRGTGFAARVDLGGGTPERVLEGPVLHVTLSQGGGNIGRDGRDFLLRGFALDRYEPSSRSWIRSAHLAREDVLIRLGEDAGGRMSFAAGASSRIASGTRWEMDAMQRGGALSTLFLPTSRLMAAGTPLSVEVPGLRSLGFNPLDRRLQAIDQSGPASDRYRVRTAPLRDEGLAAAYGRFRAQGRPGQATSGAVEPGGAETGSVDSGGVGAGGVGSGGVGSGGRLPGWLRPLLDLAAPSSESAPTQAQADEQSLRWEVERQRVARLAGNVLAAAGLERDPAAPPGPDDRRRVERLEHFLRTNFDYTLENPVVPEGEDPVISFLFERRRGHCELFAAGLVALCRSVGIPARIATGYRAGEFNPLGGYYVVRQEHAHAWVEAALGSPGRADGSGGTAVPTGWTTFDATPPAGVRAEHERAGPAWFRRLRHLAEHAEYTWVSRVVAFGPETRERAFAALRSAAVTLFSDRVGWTRWIPKGPRWRVAASAVAVAISVAACGLGLWILRRHRGARRRRAERPAAFGPTGAGGGAAARRLGFYARMLDLLERQGLERPPAATPANWAAELAAADPARFGGVPVVTAAFYRVRFGGEDPTPEEQRWIHHTLMILSAVKPEDSR